ncbi:MAG: hypothetical protein LUD12_16860 [Lachnospiraceae bacterium]|nr:hypothetical protein [Lachnospiraceae bacterium]
MSKFDFKGSGIFAYVNNNDAAIQLFEDYDIPYHEITRGENEGKIRVKSLRDGDYREFMQLKGLLERFGYAGIMDHSAVFRDVDDELIFCFSPYDMPIEAIEENGKIRFEVPNVPGYESEVRYPGIYGYGTATAVFMKRW